MYVNLPGKTIHLGQRWMFNENGIAALTTYIHTPVKAAVLLSYKEAFWGAK